MRASLPAMVTLGKGKLSCSSLLSSRPAWVVRSAQGSLSGVGRGDLHQLPARAAYQD